MNDDLMAYLDSIQSTYHHLEQRTELRIIIQKKLRSNKCVNLYGINIDDGYKKKEQKEDDDNDDVIIASELVMTQWVPMHVMIKQDRLMD